MRNYSMVFALALAVVACIATASGVFAATGDTVDVPKIDPAPCIAAATARDDDRVIAACAALIESEKTAAPDRIKALIARAGAYERTGQIDRAIVDYEGTLKADPALSDIFNARGELFRRK